MLLSDVRRGARGGKPDDDGDGLSNALEQMLGTDPFRTDTDGDSAVRSLCGTGGGPTGGGGGPGRRWNLKRPPNAPNRFGGLKK
jgi:hypothetical protein